MFDAETTKMIFDTVLFTFSIMFFGMSIGLSLSRVLDKQKWNWIFIGIGWIFVFWNTLN